jgi:hypothetical protein
MPHRTLVISAVNAVLIAGALALPLTLQAAAGPRIVLEDFRVEPRSLRLGASYVAARHDFAVTVRSGQVTIEDLGGGLPTASRVMAEFLVQPATVPAGRPVQVTVRFSVGAARSLRLTDAYYVAPTEVLPGFSYDAEKKKSFRAVPAQDDAASFRLDTQGWPTGAHHLVLQALDPSGRMVARVRYAPR